MEEVPVPPTPVVPAPEPLAQPPAPTTFAPEPRNNTKIVLLGIALVVLVVVTVVIILLLRTTSKKVSKTTIIPQASQLPTPSTTPTSTQPNLPTPPTNFSWVECKNLKSWFLQPKGWYVLEENKNGIESCFISKESIPLSGSYKTGLSVFLATGITTKTGQKPSDYAKKYLQSAGDGHTASPMKPYSLGRLQGYERKIEATVDGQDITSYFLVMGNDTNDTLYTIFFDTYRADWANDWATYGAPILSQFGLYQ